MLDQWSDKVHLGSLQTTSTATVTAGAAACDCEDEDPTTSDDGPETNDGLDNQCPGDGDWFRVRHCGP